MKQKVVMACILVISLSLTGCGVGQVFGPTITPTPTLTPVPTFTLKCNINTENFGFEIMGESGSVQSTGNSESTVYDYSSGQVSGITITVNRDLLYESSKHSYHIEGTITVKPATNELTYNITATGDAFGNSPQNCKKP